jgi:CRISPR-associated protein Cas2
MLIKCGGIRLQYSVFEFNNTKRLQDILTTKIETTFAKQFDARDSVFIFTTDEKTAIKYGNAIYHDQNLLFFT